MLVLGEPDFTVKTKSINKKGKEGLQSSPSLSSLPVISPKFKQAFSEIFELGNLC